MNTASEIRNHLKLFEDSEESNISKRNPAEYKGPIDTPNITYAAEGTSDQINKVIATLRGNDSARYTKLGRNLKRMERIASRMKALTAEVKQDSRELVADLFHAEDAACTRVVDTVSFVFHMSKDPKATDTPKYKAVLDELQNHLTPDLVKLMEDLVKKHTSTVQKAPALKATDKVGESAESIDEGIGEKLKGFYQQLKDFVGRWCLNYDRKLDKLKAQVGFNESIEGTESQSELTEFTDETGKFGGPRRKKGKTPSPSFIKSEIDRLVDIEKNDLHPAYSNFDEYLCDFWPDFSWTPIDQVEQITALLNNAEWIKAAEAVKAKCGYDFIQELKDGYAETMSEFGDSFEESVEESNSEDSAGQFSNNDLVRITKVGSNGEGEYGYVEVEDEQHYKVTLMGTGYVVYCTKDEMVPATPEEAKAYYQQPGSFAESPVTDLDHTFENSVAEDYDDGDLEPIPGSEYVNTAVDKAIEMLGVSADQETSPMNHKAKRDLIQAIKMYANKVVVKELDDGKIVFNCGDEGSVNLDYNPMATVWVENGELCWNDD